MPWPFPRRAAGRDPLAALLLGVVIAGLGVQVARAMAAVEPPRPTHLIHLASYFTDQSNALVGVVAAAAVFGRGTAGRWWPVAWLAALTGIVVTGLVYATVLAPARTGPLLASTVLLHFVAPPLAVAVWLRSAARPVVGWATLAGVMVWPAAYAAWILAYGAATGWYPYAFVDAGRLGAGALARDAALLALALLAAGAAIVAVERRRGAPRPARAGRARPATLDA